MPIVSPLPVIFLVLAAFPVILYFWIDQVTILDPPPITQDGLWRDQYSSTEDSSINVFNIDIDENKIAEMKSRLEASRFPQCEGKKPNCAFMKNLVTVMKTFDWRQHQHFLNTFKQYRTEIEGLSIHFVRASVSPPKGAQIVQILLLHGFPGSYWDFFKVIPILSNPTRYGFDFGVKKSIFFDVIVPSLPGFVFSDKPEKEGMDAGDMARILAKLMERLDIHGYFVHGTERLGADIAALLSSAYRKHVRGVHISNPLINHWWDVKVTSKLALADFNHESTSLADMLSETRFAVEEDVQSYALSDSPLGLTAYLMEKWLLYSTVDTEKQLNQLYTLDELATLVSLYWLTDTVPSAMEIMANSYGKRAKGYRAQVTVPVAVSQSPNAPWRIPESILRHQFTNITQMTSLPKGGLFHHLQHPEASAADIFGFVEKMLM